MLSTVEYRTSTEWNSRLQIITRGGPQLLITWNRICLHGVHKHLWMYSQCNLFKQKTRNLAVEHYTACEVSKFLPMIPRHSLRTWNAQVFTQKSLFSIFLILTIPISQKCPPNFMNLAQVLTDKLFKWKNISFYWFYICHCFYDLILSHVPFPSRRKNEHELLLYCFCIIHQFIYFYHLLLPISFYLRDTPPFFQHKHKHPNH